MRMLMKVKLPTAAYNRAIEAGSLPKVWGRVFGECPPEATYYVNEEGVRAVYAFLDIASPDLLATLSLPLYEHFEAEVSFVPAMVFEDLQAGISRLATD